MPKPPRALRRAHQPTPVFLGVAAALHALGACEPPMPAGEAGPEPAYEVAVALAWVAGGLDDRGGLALHDAPHSGALRSDGLAAVVDRLGKEVFLLDPGGQVVAVVGSAGQGPGEFIDPHQVGFWGDSLLWVSDAMLGRITWFDTAGGVRATWPRPWESVPQSPWNARGNWVVGGASILGEVSPRSGLQEDEMGPRPLVLWKEGEPLEVVDWLDISSPRGLQFKTDAGFPMGSRPQPIEGSPIVGLATGGRWYFVLDRTPASVPLGHIAITRYGASGSKEGVLTIAYRPRPVDDDVREWVRRSIEVSVQAVASRDLGLPARVGRLTMQSTMQSVWLPETLPPVLNALADDEGFWLQRERSYSQASERVGTWERYDLNGRLLARVALPPGFRGLAALPERLLGSVHVDGIPEVRSYEIRYADQAVR